MRRSKIRCFTNILLALLVSVMSVTAQGQKADGRLFSFGVISDVQYADADQWGKRDYRGSPQRLEKCIDVFNSHSLEFIVHTGDLIDRDYKSFDIPINIFKRSNAPVHFVVGNHEFAVADSVKGNVRRRLNNPKGYYLFIVKNIQFIVLDALDVSVMASAKDSKDHKKAALIQQDLKNKNANNAYDWNGAIGAKQLKWLKTKLEQGEKYGFKTILFSHLPVLPENGLQLWNNQEVLRVINAYPSVVAFIAGHDHDGGYVKQGHIHHLTLKGLVESNAEGACGIVDVYPDKLVVNGYGDQKDYSLSY